MEDNLKILFFTNGTASRRWRADGQADRMNRLTNNEMWIGDSKAWKGDTLGADIVVLEMITSPKMIDECHRQGAKVIYEADDAVIDTYGHERKNLMHLGENFRGASIETIAKCDAVTVSNEVLKKNYGRFTKAPIYVLEFRVDFDWYGKDNIRPVRNTDEIRLGWFGSRGHHEDLMMIAPAVKALLEKYPKVKFIYCGYGGMSSDRLMTEVGWGEDVFKDVPRDRREFVLGIPEEYWPQKHRMLDLDVALGPLVPDYFNECKTYTKWLEYSVLETPGVYSPTVYDRVVDHGKTGFIAKDTAAWIKYASRLIEDVKLRKVMGKAARQVVLQNYDLDTHWQEWVNVYKAVKTT